MLKQLSETAIFRYADSMGDAKISQTIKALASPTSGTIFVTPDKLEDALYKIRHKSFNFSAKFAVLELLNREIIRLVYNDKHKLTVAVPFFRFKHKDGGYGVIVNISNYARLEPDGSIRIDPVVLYTLMLSGAYSLVIDSHTSDAINYSIPELYSALFCNVVSRMANVDKIKRSKLEYIASKFIFIQMGVDESRATERASRSCKNIDSTLLKQTDSQFPADAYSNLETLCNAIKDAFPEFTGFTMGTFFDRWMRSYGEAAGFAIEYIPFLLTVFIALITNSNVIINVKAIEREASRHDKDMIKLFSRVENAVIDIVGK